MSSPSSAERLPMPLSSRSFAFRPSLPLRPGRGAGTGERSAGGGVRHCACVGVPAKEVVVQDEDVGAHTRRGLAGCL